ncbi:MAG: carboxypeptidase regulatory-like domain-containing protein [Verrucomicrobiota bacterium]|nr:carboxypeptidase regulatory-like domain-containing protein [Verrucomicrobiota bacterium]
MCSKLLIATTLVAWSVPAGGLWADASVEGRVELPKPTMARPLNQRYRTDVEVPEAPTDPPIAVVYLIGDFPVKNDSGAKSPAQMAQKNMMFEPELIPIQVGTAVDFPNLDETYHNVFSYSKTKRFDLGRFRKNEKPASVVFDKPGVVTIHCEIHDRMRGTILILETPYFQKTDVAGRYRLDHLPAGRYTLKAWISDNDVREHPIELKNGATLHVDLPAR